MFKQLSQCIFLFCFLLSCNEDHHSRVIDGDPEPPMPGFFQRYFTWEGVDSDNDGVIDDVEIWINETFDDVNLRKAYKQLAKDTMESLKLVNEVNKSIEGSYKIFQSQDCVSYFAYLVYESGHEVTVLQSKFRSKMFPLINNQRRSLRSKRSENFGGTIVSGSGKTSEDWKYCRFEIVNFDYYNSLMKKRYPGAF